MECECRVSMQSLFVDFSVGGSLSGVSMWSLNASLNIGTLCGDSIRSLNVASLHGVSTWNLKLET